MQVVDKLEDYLGELSDLISSEDRDDLMKGLDAIKLANTNKYPDGKNPNINKRGVSYILISNPKNVIRNMFSMYVISTAIIYILQLILSNFMKWPISANCFSMSGNIIQYMEYKTTCMIFVWFDTFIKQYRDVQNKIINNMATKNA